MIQFTVSGKPISQGSKVPRIITGRNADIDDAVSFLREYGDGASGDEAGEAYSLADRLAAVKRWPKFRKRWLINLVEQNEKELHAWRDKIAAAAKRAYRGPQIFMPVEVDATFTFIRPAFHWRSGEHANELHKWAPKYHTSFPDRDKLLRALLDALTQSGVIVDDKIVAATPGENLWSDVKGKGDGVAVQIRELYESDECREWARKRYERRKK